MGAGGIHPTAIVSGGANIADGALIGPYCVIGDGATIAAGAELKSHVVVDGRVTVGARTVVHAFTTLGGPPQHLGALKDDAELVIGADCLIREQASIHLGTKAGGGKTVISDGAFVMSAAHIGHDCFIGPGAVVASNASLGGHCIVEEGAFLGGLAALHQRVRVGAYAIVGGAAAVDRDVIPFGSAFGNRARLNGLNIIGLKRRGTSRDVIAAMRLAYQELFHGDGVFADRLVAVAAAHGEVAEVRRIVDFIVEGGARPVLGPGRD
ncbi:MAG: acyl-ACP--UDP-N-acetylglucosamine O-acyltransferase [Alphaproteobacteria bacterium]|nr:acyl-ACP--UDP-N-acetylglucosamine O-acyltransferase [Alphaproteobacteria bacterium]